MSYQRRNVGTPFSADGPALAALLEAVYDLRDMLDARLPAVTGGEPAPAGPVAVSEPAPAGPPAGELSPDRSPEVVAVSEPAPDDPPPPRAGRGSSTTAWRAWAGRRNVAVSDEATRDDIIDACRAAGALE